MAILVKSLCEKSVLGKQLVGVNRANFAGLQVDNKEDIRGDGFVLPSASEDMTIRSKERSIHHLGEVVVSEVGSPPSIPS
ncbi:hypothetical protein Nepgr_003251 [Nepenthes gracilis]|uniref:Uncharacterized protein n=1 Tax=Nepenthes gracilis TaxID=150966 RepID=A0AAD3RZ99_NEPGR|nr:hypothetical protein Nepgr_003251 [Nepenthes gracilis]